MASVVALIVGVDLLLGAALSYARPDGEVRAVDLWLALDPLVVAMAVFGTLAIVMGGTAYKVIQLWGGGVVVAEQLGGRRVTPNTTIPHERQLLNVVEEMAIAAGTSVPPVYILPRERGINAFAAGYTTSDAVIGVTRGAAQRLSRAELQGVIAHEFSHIIHGDAGLNIRLMGLLHGILLIGWAGHFLFRILFFSGGGRRGGGAGGKGGSWVLLVIMAVGVGLMVIGFAGTFLGSLIKAAVSRQREFLADASAVQFTRHPEGIAGALKKIGGLSYGARVESPNALQASHLFFGRATSGITSVFSTHPPLAERIRRLDPSWDGRFLESSGGGNFVALPDTASGLVDGVGRTTAPEEANLRKAVDGIGQLTTAQLSYAADLIAGLPPRLVEAAHEPYGARALIYALLIDRQTTIRTLQQEHLDRAADPGVVAETKRLLPMVDRIGQTARLPLVEISLVALRELTPAQYRLFKTNVDLLVEADRTVGLFEWTLRRILVHDLEVQVVHRRPRGGGWRTLAQLGSQCEVLLSTLAHVGHHDDEDAARAFDQGWQHLGLSPGWPRSQSESGFEALEAAMTDLESVEPRGKRRIVEAAAACIGADLTITVYEVELLRAISAALGCPMPPLVPTSSGSPTSH